MAFLHHEISDLHLLQKTSNKNKNWAFEFEKDTHGRKGEGGEEGSGGAGRGIKKEFYLQVTTDYRLNSIQV